MCIFFQPQVLSDYNTIQIQIIVSNDNYSLKWITHVLNWILYKYLKLQEFLAYYAAKLWNLLMVYAYCLSTNCFEIRRKWLKITAIYQYNVIWGINQSDSNTTTKAHKRH